MQWDDLELNAEYSPAVISVSGLSLSKSKTAIHASGQLHAAHARRGKLVYNNSSLLNAKAHITNASVTDLLSIAGESLPVTGTVNLDAQVGGSLKALNGGGHVSVDGGEIYGEGHKSLNTDMKFAGELVGLANLVFVHDGGRITGDGDYNIQTESLRADAASEGAALFVTGLIVSAQRFTLSWSVGWAVLAKNVIQPALCFEVVFPLAMPMEQTRYMVLLSAIPCGFFGILFGEGFDATPEVASSSLIASTLISIFTVAGWIVLLNHLH